MKADPKEVRARFEQLKQERSSWEPLWKDIRDYEAPDLGVFDGEDATKGWKRFQRIKDAEAIACADMLASGLYSGVSSPSRPWIRLTTMDAEMDEQEDVRQWLDDVQNLMMMTFAKADIYSQLHKSYLELPLFGTSCSIAVRHEENVVSLQNLTIGEYWLADDPYGRVDTMYRRLNITAKQMVQQWGIDAVSDSVRSAYETNPYERFWVIHAIEPRLDRDERKRDKANMPWRSVYWEEADQHGFLSEGGFREFPVMAPRWMTCGGSVYGRGPGATALNAAKALQMLQDSENRAAAMMLNPALQVPASYIGRMDAFNPGGRIPVTGTEASVLRTAYDFRPDGQWAELLIARKKGEIRRAFYTNIFQMIQASADQNRTATEVQALEQEKYLLLGPVLERLHSEMLDPLIGATFAYLVEADKVPPPPQIIQGKELNVEYISVLAEAQKSANISGVVRMTQQIGMLAQLNPSALDKLDVDRTIDELADMNGVPPSMIVSGDRVALIRKERAQQQAQAEQQAQLAQAASTMKDIGAAADSPGLKEVAGDLVM